MFEILKLAKVKNLNTPLSRRPQDSSGHHADGADWLHALMAPPQLSSLNIFLHMVVTFYVEKRPPLVPLVLDYLSMDMKIVSVKPPWILQLLAGC